MDETKKQPLHFCLTGVEPPAQPFEVIKGVTISPIEPRVDVKRLFRKLSEETLVFGVTFGPHIGSLRAEISIAPQLVEDNSVPSNLAWLVTSLLRLRNYEYVSCPVCSSWPISDIDNAQDKSVRVYPIEFARGQLQSEAKDARTDLSEIIDQQWVRYYYPVLVSLNDNQRFYFALHSYDASRFSEDVRFALATIWTGIESLFSQSGTEASFKMACAWAAFVEPFGPSRNAFRKEVSSLYNIRSKAVHGHSMDESKAFDSLKGTRELLRRTLLKFLEEEKIPTVDELMEKVFE